MINIGYSHLLHPSDGDRAAVHELVSLPIDLLLLPVHLDLLYDDV